VTSFQVLGVPAPQGSKTVFNGHVVEGGSTTGRAKHRAWRSAVAEAAHTVHNGAPAYDGPLSVSIKFVLPRPTGAPKKARWQSKRPDLDKLIRATLDGLTDAGMIVDDARIACLTATKTLAFPEQPWTGATVTVQHLDVSTIVEQ
jgi:crossover junction endodeoxyribonuclease RusA